VERPALVVDSGPLYAAVDENDAAHAAVVEVLEATPGPFIVPILVVAEVAYLIAKRLGSGAEARFVARIGTPDLVPEQVHPQDWSRIGELVARYRDLRLGTVDASVVAAAERLGVTRIATLDRRHFSVVRPAHVDAFELLP